MSTGIETGKIGKVSRLRKIVLFLVFLSLPFGCCGSVYLLDMLPASIIPPAFDFSLNLFETNAQVENKTNETLYITPITTTYGDPRVIAQFASVRQRDFPLPPNQTISLTYDAADMPLAGIVVCNVNNQCKLLPVDYSNKFEITSFDDLPELDASWLSLIQLHPKNSYGVIFIALFSFLPILLSGWLYVGWLEKKQARRNDSSAKEET